MLEIYLEMYAEDFHYILDENNVALLLQDLFLLLVNLRSTLLLFSVAPSPAV